MTGNSTAGAKPSPASACIVTVSYTEGANILITAIAIAFISSVLMLFSVCLDACCGARGLYRGPAPKYVVYRKPYASSSSSPPAAIQQKQQQQIEEKQGTDPTTEAPSLVTSSAPSVVCRSGISEYVVAQPQPS